jgi:hypothetical protein
MTLALFGANVFFAIYISAFTAFGTNALTLVSRSVTLALFSANVFFAV